MFFIVVVMRYLVKQVRSKYISFLNVLNHVFLMILNSFMKGFWNNSKKKISKLQKLPRSTMFNNSWSFLLTRSFEQFIWNLTKKKYCSKKTAIVTKILKNEIQLFFLSNQRHLFPTEFEWVLVVGATCNFIKKGAPAQVFFFL